MSSRDRVRAGRIVLSLALCLGLTACFRPLYGTNAAGVPLAAVLQAIEVDEVVLAPASDRFGHYLRSELVFELNGTGQPTPKRYKLALAFTSTVSTPIVDTATGRAQAAILNGVVTYTLTSLDGAAKILDGKATGSATYNRNIQRFASVRAARDAEIRLAKGLAEQIRTRLSAALIDRV
jgi:LPS-assembly lipoprotein